jgi:hypothetical protein
MVKDLPAVFCAANGVGAVRGAVEQLRPFARLGRAPAWTQAPAAWKCGRTMEGGRHFR